MVMDLVNSRMTFEVLGCSTELVTTSTGHVGFRILDDEAPPWEFPVFWGAVKKGCEQEVLFGKFGGGRIIFRTRKHSDDREPCVNPEPSFFMDSCQGPAGDALSRHAECGSPREARKEQEDEEEE